MVIAGMNVLLQSTAFSSLIFLQSADIIVYCVRSQENWLSTTRGEAPQNRHVSSTMTAGTWWEHTWNCCLCFAEPATEWALRPRNCTPKVLVLNFCSFHSLFYLKRSFTNGFVLGMGYPGEGKGAPLAFTTCDTLTGDEANPLGMEDDTAPLGMRELPWGWGSSPGNGRAFLEMRQLPWAPREGQEEGVTSTPPPLEGCTARTRYTPMLSPLEGLNIINHLLQNLSLSPSKGFLTELTAQSLTARKLRIRYGKFVITLDFILTFLLATG